MATLPAPRRPGTVTAVGVTLLFIGGLGILGCGGLGYLAAAADLFNLDRDLVLVVGAILGGGSILSAVLGYFILRGRQWARVTTIVVCVILIVGAVVSLFTGAGSGGGNLLGICFAAILNVLLIWLLSGSAASEFFRSGHR